MLRFAEDELGLPTLTNRDKGANDMMNAFDLNQSLRRAGARPAPTSLVLQQRTCTVAKAYTNPYYDD
jgi:hypothetical protein